MSSKSTFPKRNNNKNRKTDPTVISAKCVHCNVVGAVDCNESTHECSCLPGYLPPDCMVCASPLSYLADNGSCLPCPCPLDRSSGRCHVEPQVNKRGVECTECKPGFVGYRCEKCAPDYVYHSSNNTCLVGQSVDAGALSLSVAIPIVCVIAIFCLVLWCVCRRRKRRPVHKGDHKLLMADPEFGSPLEDVFSLDESDPFEDFDPLPPPIPKEQKQFERALNRRSADFYFLAPSGAVAELPPEGDPV